MSDRGFPFGARFNVVLSDEIGYMEIGLDLDKLDRTECHAVAVGEVMVSD